MALTPAQLRKLRAGHDRGNRLRAARALAKLTQVQMAPLVGLTQSALSDLERQRWSGTTVDTARRLSDFFGCTIEDLFPARQHSEVA